MKRQLAGILLTCLATAVIGSEWSEADAITFDKNKGRLYAVYLRELKADPGLKAEVALEINIATDGRVTNCRVLSSDAPNPKFGDSLCARIREFQFSPRKSASTLTKPLSFYPAR